MDRWDYTCYGGTDSQDRPFAHAEVGVIGTDELVCTLDGDYSDKQKIEFRAALIAAAPEMFDLLRGLCVCHGTRFCNYPCNECPVKETLTKVIEVKKRPFLTK